MRDRLLTCTVAVIGTLAVLAGCAVSPSTATTSPTGPAPVRTAIVGIPDDSRLAAEKTLVRAEAASEAATARAEAAHAAAQASASPAAASTPKSTKTNAPASPPPVASTDVRAVGEATLRALPGSAGVSISWNDPGLSGHLGGVWEGDTSTILVNATRLAGQPGKTADVVRHEIAHIYAGRLMASASLTWDQLAAKQAAAFGSNAAEKVADCVARRFGATWTNYTSDCSAADKQAWVDALIGGYLP